VLSRLAAKIESELPDVQALVIDDTGFPKMRIPLDPGGRSGVIRALVPVDPGAVGAKRRAPWFRSGATGEAHAVG
jgi:hypothetical protein